MCVEEKNSFVERKADEYVENHGYEIAVEKLGMLAPKSRQAKEMLDVIVSRHNPVERKQKNNKREGFVENKNFRRSRAIRPESLSPKQHFSNIVELTGISFDTRVDNNWNPVVPVVWKNGSAEIDGKQVIFPGRHMGFMKKYVLSQSKVVFDMHILEAHKDAVIAVPDIDDFFKRKKEHFRKIKEQRRKKQEKQFFKGVVRLKGDYLDVETSRYKKNIIIPREFLKDLIKGKRKGNSFGVWKFKTLEERDKKIIARPVKKLEDTTYKSGNGQLTKEQKLRKPATVKPDNTNASFVTSYVSDNRLEDLIANGSVKL